MLKIKKFHIITIGCQMNKSDSERLAGYLQHCGLKQVKKRQAADLIVINTCGVRQSAEDRVFGMVRQVRKENPKIKIAITGCLALREDVKVKLKDSVDQWILIGKYSMINDQLSINIQYPKSKKDFEIRNSKFEINNLVGCDYLNIKPKYNSSFSAFIPIGNGCDNFCSYCVVPYARGREIWRPADEILKEVSGLVAKGYKEITLIAQNVNSYKSPTAHRASRSAGKPKINFSRLLRMINDIPGNFWIRFATSHPKDMSDELIKTIAACVKVCEHIHLPVQAGDDRILAMMNRGYTSRRYIDLVKRIRKLVKFQNPIDKFQTKSKIKNLKSKIGLLPVAITTDVIVGYPGETKAQFDNTVKLFEEIKFDMAYIAQYSPRPGTAAAKMLDNVPKTEKKRREQMLNEALKKTALNNNEKYRDQVVDILIKGQGRRGGYYGETRTAKKVLVDNERKAAAIKPGEFRLVRIREVREFGLRGDLIG